MLQQTPAPPRTLAEVFIRLYTDFLSALPGLLRGVLIFAIFLLIAGIGRRLIAEVAPRARADTGVVLLLSRVFYYGVLILGILTALPVTGLNVSALVAGLGLTGFAIGFALKDVLSNLLAGIMLLVYRPFQIGDQIKMGEHEGAITTIRMRDTVLRAADGRSVIIPNTKLITEVVVNNSTVKLARDTIILRLADEKDLPRARRLLLETLGAESDSVRRVEPQVGVTQENSGGEIKIDCGFFYDPRHVSRADVQARVGDRVRRAFDAASIEARVLPPPSSPAPAPLAGETEDSDESKREG